MALFRGADQPPEKSIRVPLAPNTSSIGGRLRTGQLGLPEIPHPGWRPRDPRPASPPEWRSRGRETPTPAAVRGDTPRASHDLSCCNTAAMEARAGPPRRWSRAVTILIPVVWVWLYEVTGPR